MRHLLGIDVGTGGTRALVIDEQGQIVASATSEHVPFASPQTGWAEQDPRDWWRATGEAARAAIAKAGGADRIAAVGFSGQMHGSSMLDASGEVVRPALLWCDQRPDAECRETTERIGAARLIALTLNPALTDSRCRSSSGCASTSPTSGRPCARCCCRRTTSAFA